MKKNILWITRTAVLLALLVCLQWVTKPLGQLVTGSCVNAVLAVAALFCGMGSGLCVALLSPVCAYLLGIAPQLVTVPAIMAGNSVYVLLLALLAGRPLWRNIAAWLAASAAKFAVLYVLVVKVVCGLAAGYLQQQGLLKAPMLKALPGMFTWLQLFTALIGGAVALAITPVLRKAIKE